MIKIIREGGEHAKALATMFPKDAVERAEKYLKDIGSAGAYSHSQGIPIVRKEVAQFLQGTELSFSPF
jgi:alanine transaminase